MRKTGNGKRLISGFLAGMTMLTAMISPVNAYAAESPEPETEEQPPLYEEIKDQLDKDEVVEAGDYEIIIGTNFDVGSDFTGLEIPDDTKVTVTFQEAKNEDGEEFSTDHLNIYEAVYYVEPTNPEHPKYQISRNLIVKEAGMPEAEPETESSEIEAQTEELILAEEDVLSGNEFDALAEQIESQETVDPETGVTLSDVMEEAVEQGVDLGDMEAGETVAFDMPRMLSANSTGIQAVTITAGQWYAYSDYDLGSYYTRPYYVTWGSVSATAYCVQPSKAGPDDGTYTITKLSDGKTLAKVCYYGTKASEENGFFDEKHPDFSAGKRFIITHLAASYANGSSDWDSGTNAAGRALAMELYNYCVSMPDIPDVDMSFSEDHVKAYVEGNSQRTKTVTFQADELQTITFQLPSGVKLVNVSTGMTSDAGASVEICGGTQFYLTAPLTQAEDVSETFSTTMKGSIDKEYSAYKITTGSSTQDLALVFGEGVGNEKYVDFHVTWSKECYVSIVKKDSETRNTLAGAVYGIYSDAACTDLIQEMPATDVNGASKAIIEKTQEVVYLKEISVPEGYTIDAKAYHVTLNIGKTSSQNVTDKRVSARISLSKQDAETGSEAQGDASLEGAVYGLFAREDIVHPDGKTGVLYPQGTQVATLTTDGNGQASISDLYLGNYYLKELTPPTGYLLDLEEHEIDCSYEGDSVPVVERAVISKEDVIKQPFQVIKVADNGKTDADLLDGVGFSAWLVSSLKVKKDGSYDFSSADPVVVTVDGRTEMFTDERGYACSIPLPYGTYVVRETTGRHNFDPVDDFIVTVSENHPDTPQVWRVLLDDEFEAKLKIIKKDDETKRSVLLPDTEFKVYDLEKEEYVEQVTTYPSTKVHASYFTDESGCLILPDNLKVGNYRIEEVTAPYGYTRNQEYVEISVDSNTAYQVDPVSGDILIEVDYENHSVKGKLTVTKMGEMLSGFHGDFIYKDQELQGAVFEVYAAEDIYSPDYQKDDDGNRILVYAKDTVVTTITTGEDGMAVAENLPLGRYRVIEKTAPEGYVRSSKTVEVSFEYEGQDTPVVEQEITFADERQKVEITVEKQDAENGAVVEGAVFGIYNKEDISVNGKVIVKAGTLLQEMVSDERGQALCTLDLPLGSYDVKEQKAPAGYVSSEEVLEFDASYQGQEVETVILKSVKKNEPTTVEVTKSDLTTGTELEGARLKVLDKNGNVVDEWTSVKDAPHVIRRLEAGEAYTLHEELAPYGYLKATDVTFTVEDTADIQEVEMKDEVPTGLLIINKKGEFLDKVTLLDHAKGIVEHLFEYVNGTLTEVTFNVYAAEDIKAADGVSEDYFKADELVGTITTDYSGTAQLDGLPVGKYYVREAKTANGYVLDTETRYVDLGYRDQDTPVVTYEEDWQNLRQKVEVTVLKKEKDTDEMLAGGIFGLFTRDEIKGADGTILMEADTIIEQRTTDENGQITFTADLPIDGKYYVKELYAPEGYVTSNEEQDFTFAYAGADLEEVRYEFVFENEPTKVTVSKTDLTGKQEVPGAKLTILDKDDQVVESWVSAEEPHYVEKLPVGSYMLREEQAPKGYVLTEDVSFEVLDTGEIQTVSMRNDTAKGRVIPNKTDAETGEPLRGVEFELRDSDGNVLETLKTDAAGHAESGLYEIADYADGEFVSEKRYVLVETKALDGYGLDGSEHEVLFEYVDDSTPVVEVTFNLTNQKEGQADTAVSDAPKTGDKMNLWIPLVLLAVSASALAGVWTARKKKD